MPARRNKVGVLDGFDVENPHKERRTCGLLGVLLTLLSVGFIILTFPVTAWTCAQVIQQYERAVIFRLGRVVTGPAKGPGLFWFIPWLDSIHKVDLRTVSFHMRPQEILTADGVSLKASAAVFYQVVEPSLWVTRVKDGHLATHTLAQTVLRATLGKHTLAEVLTQSARLARKLKEALCAASSEWGVWVERVALMNLSLPAGLQRCLASEAEASRKARAKMIAAKGEAKASRALKEAASNLPPVALHLRYLQALSSAPSSTNVLVVSLPTELMDAFIANSQRFC
ncbi:stomatin [Dunckerocampus dactyliophorus]|uniref:stomatin n=1 Tax=Dunckerocampus dactyliophorus TaxID=161453 RepID=UPI002406C722|nr:stomatin [Dunckerocampus dactyliophorus]